MYFHKTFLLFFLFLLSEIRGKLLFFFCWVLWLVTTVKTTCKQQKTEQQQQQIFSFREISFSFNFEHNGFNEHKCWWLLTHANWTEHKLPFRRECLINTFFLFKQDNGAWNWLGSIVYTQKSLAYPVGEQLCG